MTIHMRVGTRGSDLAVWQTNWVCDRLREAHPSLEIEQVIITTQGDANQVDCFGKSWPVGAFVSAIEQALLDGRIDFAVHSFKDLQTAETPGLTIAAVPPREVPHDVILTRSAVALDTLCRGGRIGTGSPRRTAQLQAMGDVTVVPIRGNVPTRIAKLESEQLDGVVLAAAGVKRLGVQHPHVIDLSTDTFLPAPAQGALAIQTRTDDAARGVIEALDDEVSRRAVTAERSVLRRINAGCHTPIGAYAVAAADGVALHARLFSDDYAIDVDTRLTGADPQAVGSAVGDTLLAALKDRA